MALDQLESYDQYNHQLFDLIDEIEHSKVLEKILTIPSVVAAGDQTSGKSSVLGKLSGVPLPTGDGTVTLCATQLALRKSTKKLIRMMDPEVKDIADISEICAVVQATQQRLMPQNGGFIFDAMPRIRIENPEARNLTVVDLPGIIHSANKTQDEDVVENVKNMVARHIESRRTIILCVIDSTRDLALNKIFNLVNKVDPEGNRTIVVFTKIDKCLQDKSRIDHFLSQIQSQDYHTFKHHVFVNSLMDDDEEADFFKTVCQNFQIEFANCTYKSLYSKVCGMLLKPVLNEFRTSWNQVELFRNKLIEERNRLPRNLADPEVMANDKLTEFIDVSREILKGNYSGRSPSSDLFSKYRQFFRSFKTEYSQKMQEVAQSVHMDDVAIRWRHQEMVNFHNWANFKCYAVPIITSFLKPAIKCHNAIRSINKEAIIDMVWEIFSGQDAHANFLIDKVNAIFESQEHVLNERLHQIFEYEKYFYTDDELYEKLLEKYPNGSLPNESSGSGLNPASEPMSTLVDSKKIKKVFGKKSRAPTMMTLTRGGDEAETMSVVEDKASLNEELEYTDAEMGNFYNGLEAHYQTTKDSRKLFPLTRFDFLLSLVCVNTMRLNSDNRLQAQVKLPGSRDLWDHCPDFSLWSKHLYGFVLWSESVLQT